MALPRHLEYTTLPTPFGEFTAVWSADDMVVRASGFSDVADIRRMLPRGERRLPIERRDDDTPVRRAVTAHLDRDPAAFDDLRVSQPGSPFFQSCWASLRSTGPGERISFRDLAKRSGRPRAVRTARKACAANRIVWIVPCHRAVRPDGRPGQYRFGVSTRLALLDWEAGRLGGDAGGVSEEARGRERRRRRR